jgi:hypothetical protein
VWNRYSTRLHRPRIRNAPGDWISRDNAFPAVVDRATFDQVQLILRTRHRRWSDEQLLDSLSNVLKRSGYISEHLVKRTAGMASLSTYYRRLGTWRQIHIALGCRIPDVFQRSDSASVTRFLRDELVTKILSLFPGTMSVTHMPGKRRPVLRVQNGALISLQICHRLKLGWVTYPISGETENLTLVCLTSPNRTGCGRYYLLPRIPSRRRLLSNSVAQLLKTGFRLNKLTDLYRAAELFTTANRLHS